MTKSRAVMKSNQGDSGVENAAIPVGKPNQREEQASAATGDERPVIEYEWIGEVAEVLAGALHEHNTGRDIRGWRDVSEAFDSLKAILRGRYDR